MVTLTTTRFFFSGDIYLSPKNSLEVDETKLTKTQLLDILEANTLGTLSVSSVDSIRTQYNTLTSFNRVELETQLGDLKTKVEDLETKGLDTPLNIDTYISALEPK